MRQVDVVVVGAGPAGAAASIELARAGREVVLVDKATFPRDKCCGDGLTTGALRHLEELGLSPSSVASWLPVDACWVRSPSGRTVEFPFPDDGTFGAVARRADLDHALVEVARSAGAAVHEGHAVTDVQWSAHGVTAAIDGAEPIAGRYLVAADGMWSPVRKALGAGETGYLGEWHAFRQYLSAAGPEARRLWVWFEEGLLPGYAWSFPLPDGVVNVGFGMRRKRGEPTRSMADTWRQLLEVDHIRNALGDVTPLAAHKAWPIPARLPHATLTAAGGRVLFVGDAARASDPMTGEGIGQALETGRLAASVIVAAGPTAPDAAAARFRDTLSRGMSVDHQLAALLSMTLRSPAGARGAVRIAGASAWTRRNFGRWLFEDYPRATIATPRRWHRQMLRGPGAFRGR
ncbi:MAG: NAD(P)/FAD-dependent oxidoreductase [Acidimicrobiales bacterium]